MTAKILFYGSQGWIGSLIVQQLLQSSQSSDQLEIVVGKARADDIEAVKQELTADITHVICTVGRTKGSIDGKAINSIDYLEHEGKLVENLRDNLFAPIGLAKLCQQRHIHLTYLGTGCIFSAVSEDAAAVTITDHIYDEASRPDFFGSSYSVVKGYTDRLMTELFADSVLNVRIRMPITQQPHASDFITKIVGYSNICSMDNSMTVLDDLLPLLVKLVLDKQVGTINLVNPGYINHQQILQLYQQYCQPEHSWRSMTLAEQRQMLKSDRSNNVLSSTKAETLAQQYGLTIPDITTSITNILKWRASH